LLFDVHLMISRPKQYVSAFVDAGADHITFHVEADDDAHETIDTIRAGGCTVGMTLKPGTPAAELKPYLSKLDMVLVMTVEPGFGGQSFMHDMLDKVSALRGWIDADGLDIQIEVDGGVSAETAPLCIDAGADLLVAGSSVFRHPDGLAAGIRSLRPH
jgi:ribulose-phosphate 3-epimerase